MAKPVFLLIGARKRVGKDTAALMAVERLRELNYNVARVAFADALKCEVQQMLNAVGMFGISAHTEDPDTKENIVRPLLIAHGCARRHLDPNYWVDKVIERGRHLSAGWPSVERPMIVVVSDWRFANEFHRFAEFGLKAYPTCVLNSRIENTIPEERKNAPECELLAIGRGQFIPNEGSLGQLRQNVETTIDKHFLPFYSSVK